MKYLFFIYSIIFFVQDANAGPWAKTFNKEDKRPFFAQYADTKKSIEKNTMPPNEQKFVQFDQKATPTTKKIIIKNE